jgi:hypothetical protein
MELIYEICTAKMPSKRKFIEISGRGGLGSKGLYGGSTDLSERPLF